MPKSTTRYRTKTKRRGVEKPDSSDRFPFPEHLCFYERKYVGIDKNRNQNLLSQFFNLRLNEEAILLGVSPDSANKFRSRTRQKLCPGQKGSDINRFILQKDGKSLEFALK